MSAPRSVHQGHPDACPKCSTLLRVTAKSSSCPACKYYRRATPQKRKPKCACQSVLRADGSCSRGCPR